MIADAIIDKPKRSATRLGTFGEILYAVSPTVALSTLMASMAKRPRE